MEKKLKGLSFLPLKMGLAPIVMLMGFLLRWGPAPDVAVVVVEVRVSLAVSEVMIGADVVERGVAAVETGGTAAGTEENGIDEEVVAAWSIELLTPTLLLSLQLQEQPQIA